jgi:NADP-dependent aldehyde dehydrogenase
VDDSRVLTGKNLIAGEPVDASEGRFSSGGTLAPFEEATSAHVDRALADAEQASREYRGLPAGQRARFLDCIADEIEQSADLIEVANLETALPAGRLAGERTRTAGQLRLFANLVREGSWVDARIDRAMPARQPLPRPDIRRMLIPIGPVAVFGASNFPLAFSVAGGDTASALAAGCPVVVKAHPAHPATSELAARAIINAVRASGVPAGVFSLLHSTRHAIGEALVLHRHTRAVGFTGSLRAGRALFDAAARRGDPIPVYAEMGSVNPVFLLPGALAARADAIAEGLTQSVTMGVGQFCTNPGLVIGIGDASFDRFLRRLEALIEQAPPGTMLYPALCQAYEDAVRRLSGAHGVSTVRSSASGGVADGQARPSLFAASAQMFLRHRELGQEV